MSVGTTWSFSTSLTEIQCGQCGGVYALAENYRREKQQQGGFWNCPYCRCSWGYGEGENARLKKQLAQEKHNAEQTQARLRQEAEFAANRASIAERRRAAMKGQVTRIKNRVGKGVCPCCRRHFVNLQRHMQGQHPDWAPESQNDDAPLTNASVS
jgi:hypothetical protein